MANTISCPKCGSQIEVTEALKHQIEDEVLVAEKTKHQEDLVRVRKESEEKARKELEEKTGLEILDLKKTLTENEQKITEFRKRELEFREERRRIEDEKKELELTVQKRVDEERKKVEESVSVREAEKNRLVVAEYEEKLKSMQRSLEDAQRKAQQGSQQTQGEVLELDLEENLRSSFAQDVIEPVGKGVKGADIRQIVKSQSGVVCGVILWESKRTKDWHDDWTQKLKDDLRAEGANVPVIVSEILPKEAQKGMGIKDGVWVVSFSLVIPLAMLLRRNLLEVAYHKMGAVDRSKKSEQLYEYVTGHEFIQQVEATLEVYREMQENLNREKTAYEKIWKAREFQIKRLLNSTASICGSMQGLIGSSMPQIKGLELLELTSGKTRI